MNQKYLLIGISIAVLIIAGFLVYTSQPVVSAQGYSTLKVKPDTVSISISIDVRNKSAEAAQIQANSIRDSIVARLKTINVPDDEVQFGSYSIYPDYDWSNGQQTQKGFVAHQDIIVKTENFDLVPKVVDQSIGTGALISYINFELSPEKQNDYKTEALQAASKDASKKASATAAGLGKSLGRLVSVQSQEFNYPGPIVYYARAAEAGSSDVKQAASNLAPQDIEVTGAVMVEYKLSLF